MSDQTAARFVDAFTKAWADPTPQRLVSLLDPEVRLVAPLTRTTNGTSAARAEFATLLDLLPGLHARVHGWSGTSEQLFIYFTLSAPVAGRSVEWDLIDKFRLRGELALERISYFDPLPVMLGFARHPSTWSRLLRSGLRRLRY